MTLVLSHPRGPHSAGSSDVALRALYRDHAVALLAYAEWFAGDRLSAEDAVQETFLRAWRHLPRLLADGRPMRPWLRHVLRHVLIDAARTARAHPVSLHEDVPVEHVVEGGYESLLDRGVLAVVLRDLSPVHREVLVEVYYRDATCERVAARLGVPAGTVRSRLYYALRAVRDRLVELAEAPATEPALRRLRPA
ncbi:sigma-70 family RNA polymerase sigma factor [Pseudonocardia yunnanensis]|uniref:Sigma-70 family RNA polymerase sigma factor n=1 Tax=Pseudonocardia yunnanensis TaxID=58107 RepID=A0ABW4F503_9PSEU